MIHESEIDCETLLKSVLDAEKEITELNLKMQDLVVHENEINSETFLKTVMDAETEVNEFNFRIQDLVLHENEIDSETILKTVTDAETEAIQDTKYKIPCLNISLLGFDRL